MRKLVVGILAHVDAGKTTLSEALLYQSGALRRLGRVDHQDAFLDTDAMERERGITIFSKQAVFSLKDTEVTLLDTPGHVDFSAEAERTLQVLDCAILVISGTDGVQAHTRTLWRLLERYHVPTFLFINKMDLAGADRSAVLAGLKQRLGSGCVDFSGERDESFREEAAVCDESVLERYLETGVLTDGDLRRMVGKRKLFPCWFGSALKLEGVSEFLEGVEQYAPVPAYPETFGARIYKIARDGQGTRLTYLKVTGGTLRVKSLLTNRRPGLGEDQVWEEKADQIRIYSGAKFRTVEEAPAGTVCAVTGLSRSRAGEGLGLEAGWTAPALEPVLTYQVLLPEGTDPHTALGNLRQLEEEDPQLHIAWNEQTRQIHVQLMGEIQLEILQRMIRERFGLEVAFGPGTICYRETIAAPVEGIGHFEPLRHYAEVHLLLEPGERGSGLDLGPEKEELAGRSDTRRASVYAGTIEQDKELQAIFERTYGPVKRRAFIPPKDPRRPAPTAEAEQEKRTIREQFSGPEYLLVDGYNIIFAWDELKAIARDNLDAARKQLCDLLSNYRGFRKCEVIAVFDAYKVKGGQGSVEKYHDIHVVYTKEAETADAYIERATYEIGRRHRVRVATSDGPEQLIILGHGALRLSASAFRQEVEQVEGQIADILAANNRRQKTGNVRSALERAQRQTEEEKP